MWGKKESTPPGPPPKAAAPPESSVLEVKPVSSTPMPKSSDSGSLAVPARPGQAHIGKSVIVKGEISSSEDLYVDGEVRGAIQLRDHSLTVGPNGKVEANVVAREIVVHGALNGNVQASDKIEIRKTGSLLGDLQTARIIIEDGAYFKGSIDILKPGQKPAEAPRGAGVPSSAARPVAPAAQPSLQMAASADAHKP